MVAGGHSVSFIARHLLDTCQEAIDAVARGEGETVAPRIPATDRDSLHEVPGVVTRAGAGPPPTMLSTLDEPLPARHLLPHRSRYFIGGLDPCASVEFTRGCPWDCSFCSAWTFYGRSYRRMSPDVAGHELATIQEPNVFLVDDVAFIKPDHGMAIADQIERRRIRKRYYLETRADVLLRHPEVFRRWHRLGLTYMFLGMEALDAGDSGWPGPSCVPGESRPGCSPSRMQSGDAVRRIYAWGLCGLPGCLCGGGRLAGVAFDRGCWLIGFAFDRRRRRVRGRLYGWWGHGQG